ncbi:MAG: OmpA family protein, partial [Bacteroidota bacterium]
DETSGAYSGRLALGKKSSRTASADSYFPVAEIVDVTDEIENVELTQDLILVPLKVGEAILLNNITFETASAVLKGDSFSDMDRVIDLLKAFPALKIEIAGHTDSSGGDASNLRLSQARAESVTEYILAHGISPDRVVSKGHGESKPVATNLTPGGRAQNRRVEFVVLEL